MKTLLAAAAALAAVLIPGIAAAQQCIPADLFLAIGRDRYGEVPLFSGLSKNGARIVVVWNEKSGSWTIAVQPPGQDCIAPLGSGDGGTLHGPGGSM